jgi:hypothetical protein
MRAFLSTYLTILGIALLASCASSANAPAAPTGSIGNSGATNPNVAYTQIERLARPAVKEAMQSYDQHDSTARANPYSDPTLPGSITTFMTTVAGRSSATASTLQSVLIPDEMVADLSQLGPGVKAAYLGVETGGVTGSKFGGRSAPTSARSSATRSRSSASWPTTVKSRRV